jgi:hypothetical protein
MCKGAQVVLSLAVMTAVLVLLLHPATPGVTAPVDGKQVKQIQSVIPVIAATLAAFTCAAQVRLYFLATRNTRCERSSERTSFCSLLC